MSDRDVRSLAEVVAGDAVEVLERPADGAIVLRGPSWALGDCAQALADEGVAVEWLRRGRLLAVAAGGEIV